MGGGSSKQKKSESPSSPSAASPSAASPSAASPSPSSPPAVTAVTAVTQPSESKSTHALSTKTSQQPQNPTMGRKFLIGGNWKMNGNKGLVDTLVKALNEATWEDNTEVVISPPFPYLDSVRKTLKPEVGVAAQNIYNKLSGAYTGEVSVEMLKDIGVNWAIIGHSERREYFGETDEVVGKKTAFAIANDISVMACVGEKLDERESGSTTAVVFRQLAAIAAEVKDWSKVVIAYEPVWAIGTGKVATPEQAQEVHAEIRGWLAANVSDDVAASTRILYGGSVNAGNCKDLAAFGTDIDGFLVGGASLKAADFITIVRTKSA